MDFSELCALVGALRDRVADLEARQSMRDEHEVQLGVDFCVSLAGAEGDPAVAKIAERAVMKALGFADGGQVASGKLYTISERGPETIKPRRFSEDKGFPPEGVTLPKADWPKF